jgi:hypothetical protein
MFVSECCFLQVLDAVARMACLGSDKAYREVVVLLTQNYVSKLSVVGSSQSRTLAPEAMTERLEVILFYLLFYLLFHKLFELLLISVGWLHLSLLR